MRCAAVLGNVLASVLALAVLAAGALVGCNDPQSPPKTPQKDDGVPANSLSDARLHGEQTPKDKGPPSGDSKADPTQPYTTKMGEAPPPEPGTSGGKGGSKGTNGSSSTAGSGSSGASASGGKGAVSKSECDRVMDKYLQLEIAQNPQLKDVPPDVIEQAKQMAREKHGDAPCTATRTQYTCAMAAASTGAWQRCMK